jgi:hypothetical protein
MPITRRQFELGIDEGIERFMRSIHAQLSLARRSAFSKSELARAVGLPQDYDDSLIFARHPFDIALEKLVEIGAAEAKVLNSTVYYVYRKDLPILR